MYAIRSYYDLGWQWGGVGDLQRDITFPFGFEWGDVDNDAAAGIGALPQTDGEHLTRYLEILVITSYSIHYTKLYD